MSIQLHRREFLRNSIQASVSGAVAVGAQWPFATLAKQLAPATRSLENVLLDGGSDARLLFVPAPNHDQVVSRHGYTQHLWRARAALYPRRYSRYADLFVNHYLPVTDPLSGMQFGIHDSCAWLRREFEWGRVAIVANTFSAGDLAWSIRSVNDPRAGVASVRHGGWNSTRGQYLAMTRQMSDLFGAKGILSERAMPRPGSVVSFMADSGRQLVANRAGGTQPGGASVSLLIGEPVRGGVYGDLFPEREAMPDGQGRIPLETPGAVIQGLTTNEAILDVALAWANSESKQYPSALASAATVEGGVNLGQLFA